jgi:hypothetical protein
MSQSIQITQQSHADAPAYAEDEWATTEYGTISVLVGAS